MGTPDFYSAQIYLSVLLSTAACPLRQPASPSRQLTVSHRASASIRALADFTAGIRAERHLWSVHSQIL